MQSLISVTYLPNADLDPSLGPEEQVFLPSFPIGYQTTANATYNSVVSYVRVAGDQRSSFPVGVIIGVVDDSGTPSTENEYTVISTEYPAPDDAGSTRINLNRNLVYRDPGYLMFGDPIYQKGPFGRVRLKSLCYATKSTQTKSNTIELVDIEGDVVRFEVPYYRGTTGGTGFYTSFSRKIVLPGNGVLFNGGIRLQLADDFVAYTDISYVTLVCER